ncbi:HNH endonuclease signature motif containing protein [Luteipulveratus sp. YIM 133132]|uniref:HNH endonuclease n=1 Tax=Luteipulveratus flavus TaxID=3031728 RepID=UPI0023AF9355|nr:HNH endonuclease signature motif containing protein [Luteipulveratus sp. YIM 133132]MDE9367693.1 HNH endonuclease signature motif containing protein [Luteipulveratus sp. YIM 133132]
MEIGLVMSASTLLDDGREPGLVDGHGPVPAALARTIAAGEPQAGLRGRPPATDSDGARARAWVRRVFADPVDGTAVAVDSRRRTFGGPLRRLISARDRVCRTPFCDAPIQHHDHVVRYTDGGLTDAANGQGLCERCNDTKELPGWSARVVHPGHERGAPRAGPAHEVEITTPTGHRHRSVAPSVLGGRPRPFTGDLTVLERRVLLVLSDAA